VPLPPNDKGDAVDPGWDGLLGLGGLGPHPCQAWPSRPRVVTRTFPDGRTDERSDDGRRGVRDLDAL
jgi:hypothetical protein